MDEPTQMVTHTPDRILRCIKMRPGMVAVSGLKIWTKTNATINTLASTNSKMILHSLHAYVDPPHCSASKRQTVPGSRAEVPRMSS